MPKKSSLKIFEETWCDLIEDQPFRPLPPQEVEEEEADEEVLRIAENLRRNWDHED